MWFCVCLQKKVVFMYNFFSYLITFLFLTQTHLLNITFKIYLKKKMKNSFQLFD